MLALRAREAGVALEKVVGDDLPEIVADKRALNQILLNLVSNAIRFTDRGGKVMVSARAEAADITFVVEDNGVGISDAGSGARRRAVLSRRAHPTTAATAAPGWGFPSSRAWCGCTAARCPIRSRIGEGTRITVCLPLDCERARPAKQHPAQATVSALNRRSGPDDSKAAAQRGNHAATARSRGA